MTVGRCRLRTPSQTVETTVAVAARMLDLNHLIPVVVATATTAIPSALYAWQHGAELTRQLKQRDEDKQKQM